MDPSWFQGEGMFAVAIAAMFFVIAGGTQAWLQGPGSRPHDPPVARDQVRRFAMMFGLFGALWLVRSVVGVGGFLLVSAILLVGVLALAARTHVRRS